MSHKKSEDLPESSSKRQQQQQQQDDDATPSLSQLLASLTVGVRAVQGLPSNRDDWDYHLVFGEFKTKLDEVQSELVDETLASILSSFELSSELSFIAGSRSSRNNSNNANASILVDPHDENNDVWEDCANLCDALMEQVEAHLEAKDIRSNVAQLATLARQTSQSKYHAMISNIVDMEKPQKAWTVNNARTEPFVPEVHPEKPFAKCPLDLTLRPGHGMELKRVVGGGAGGRMATSCSSSLQDVHLVAPSHHCPHPYQMEIEAFAKQSVQEAWEDLYRFSQNNDANANAGSNSNAGFMPKRQDPHVTWIDTESQLQSLAERLVEHNISQVAVDLEAHSHRSFSGFTCLMQMTLKEEENNTNPSSTEEEGRGEDFCIDTIALRSCLNKYLAPMFANPSIRKVMHGADSDIVWLQRDFGIYVVNLFDTGQVARALGYTSASLAYLLRKFVHPFPLEEQEKKSKTHFQLSDWRQRPLPSDMLEYAATDTRYLLDISYLLAVELSSTTTSSSSSPLSLWETVFAKSQQICLSRYNKEPFFNPMGYKSLIRGNGGTNNNNKRKKNKQTTTSLLSEEQMKRLKALYDWRDATARRQDESLFYVCSNTLLVRMAMKGPTTVAALQSLANPMPPLVLELASEIISICSINDSDDNDNEGEGEHAAAMVRKDATTKTTPTAGGGGGSGGGAAAAAAAAGQQQQQQQPKLQVVTSSESTRGNSGGVLSPVMETEALYAQAGWMTPSVSTTTTRTANTTTDRMEEDTPPQQDEGDNDIDDEDDDESKGLSKRMVTVDSHNDNYNATQYTKHSLELSGRKDGRGKRVGGSGGCGSSSSNGTTAGKERSQSTGTTAATTARQIIRQLLTDQGKQDVLGILTNMELDDDEDDDDSMDENNNEVDQQQQGGDKKEGGDDNNNKDDWAIPKSMKEIYKMSNRNRRRKKPVNLPKVDDDDAVPPELLTVDTLEGAQALIRSSGLDFKRQRQEVTGQQKQQQQQPQGSGAGGADVDFMKDLGWIKSRKEAETMLTADTTTSEGGSRGAAREGDEQQQQQMVDEKDSKQRQQQSRGSSKKDPPDGSAATPTSGASPSISTLSSSAAAYNSGIQGVYNPSAPPSSNPFFAGAALRGGALAKSSSTATTAATSKSTSSTKQSKGGANNNNNKGSNSRNYSGGSRPTGRKNSDGRTLVYKSSS